MHHARHGAHDDPDRRRPDPSRDDHGELDRHDVAIFGGAGPLLAILAMALVALLSVLLTGGR